MISNKELIDIKGGFAIGKACLIGGAIISFIAGIIDGYIRPLKCN